MKKDSTQLNKICSFVCAVFTRRYLSFPILQYLPDLLFFSMKVWLTSLIFCPKLLKKTYISLLSYIKNLML